MTFNINDMTIGQARELIAMFNAVSGSQEPKQPHPFVGKYVIARCYSAGVHAGEVVSVDGENVVLKDSRRLWQWKAKDGVALSGVAQHGVQENGTKIDVLNPIIYLTGVCELIPVADEVRENINAKK